jgi:hypothetical protein
LARFPEEAFRRTDEPGDRNADVLAPDGLDWVKNGEEK